MVRPRLPEPPNGPDEESRAWVAALGDEGAGGDAARRELHDLLLRAARHEIRRRRDSLPHLRGGDLDDLAHQSADDALLAILAKLGDYRGDSRFTTWAYKFALLEAAVKLRRRAWQGREVPIESEHWAVLADRGDSPASDAESRELLAAIAARDRDRSFAASARGAHRRRARRRSDRRARRADDTTRGALYKTIHDARRKLRAVLAEQGLRFEAEPDPTEVTR